MLPLWPSITKEHKESCGSRLTEITVKHMHSTAGPRGNVVIICFLQLRLKFSSKTPVDVLSLFMSFFISIVVSVWKVYSSLVCFSEMYFAYPFPLLRYIFVTWNKCLFLYFYGALKMIFIILTLLLLLPYYYYVTKSLNLRTHILVSSEIVTHWTNKKKTSMKIIGQFYGDCSLVFVTWN